jgi:serine/threonine protein kinase
VDAWALGIILYFMLFGKYPFEGSKENEIFDKIIKEDHVYPFDILVSHECYKLINGLLTKSQKTRIDMADPLFQNWYDHPGSDEVVIRKVVEKRLSFAPESLKLVSESISPRKMNRKSTKNTTNFLLNKPKARSNSTIVVTTSSPGIKPLSTMSKGNIKLLKIDK